MPDDIVQQLKDAACGNDCHCHYCERNKAAANEIERLRSQRDEARREVCEITMPCLGSQKGYAKGRGWDCYKEETP